MGQWTGEVRGLLSDSTRVKTEHQELGAVLRYLWSTILQWEGVIEFFVFGKFSQAQITSFEEGISKTSSFSW